MTKKVEELSASGVKKFVECPKRFYLHYLSEVPEPEEGEIEHFEIGNTVHDSIENVLRSSNSLNNQQQLLEALKTEKEHLDYNYSDNDKVDNCLSTASRWISSFVEEVSHVEEKWSMNRDGIRYKGLADLIADVQQDDRTYTNSVVDWKTGEVNEEWKERVQGGMYAEMHYEIYGEYPEAIIFVYLDEETQSLHPRVTDGKVFWNEKENKYWQEILEYKDKILQNEVLSEWEAKPEQSRCYFCSYKHHCEDSPVGAENIGPNEIEIGNPILGSTRMF